VKIVYTPYIHSLISKADVVVLSSKKEGVPRSIMEAMALRKPIVATDVPGTNELVVNGETGILVPFGDQEALNEAALRLLIDKSLGAKLGEEGRTRVVSQYSGEKGIVALWVKTYEEVLCRARSTRDKDMVKRVLFVSTLGYTMEAFLIPYMDIFIRKGFEVVALSNWKYRWNILPAQIKTVDCPFSRKSLSLWNLIAFFKLLGYFKREKFQFIYTHTPIASAIVRLSKRITANKALVIYEIHGLHIHEKGIPLLNSIFKWVECSLASFTDKIITINHDDYSFARQYFTKSQIYYSPGIGVDLDHYSPQKIDAGSLRLQYAVRADIPVIVTIADFITRKRIDLCIDAAQILRNEGFAFKWFILGDGLLKASIAELVRENDLQDFVILTGQQKDVRQFLALSDIFVLLSIQEGLPRSLLEAGAMGLPAVVSDIRGNRDLVEHGENSYLTPTGNAGAAAHNIKMLLTNETLRRDFGAKLKAKIAKEFSLENTMAIHETIFFGQNARS
jgi:glycosyltransferase involved in cell wall biosynthesis